MNTVTNVQIISDESYITNLLLPSSVFHGPCHSLFNDTEIIMEREILIIPVKGPSYGAS